MPAEWTVKARVYGIELEDDEYDALEEIYQDGDIGQYYSEDVVAVARDNDGDIIGGITESGDELTIGVDEGWQGHGIGTAMIKALLAEGGGGFMVAGTDAGSEFLWGLYDQLTEAEREELDVPSWADREEGE
jgi:GNAT superfamily N-acetyltransferase